MAYSLYKLNFSTPLHLGMSTGGQSLDDGGMTIHADTLFAALCCEGAKDGRLEQLVDFFSEGTLAISDTFPYNEQDFFLPKPILFLENTQREGDPGLKKSLKAIEYIPLALFQKYLRSLRNGTLETEKLEVTFGNLTTSTRVALKGQNPSLPYHLASWRFAPGCGLYVVVRWENEYALAFLADMLTALGLSGVGGKTSSGLGKFSLELSPCPAELVALLEDRGAAYQMLLGTALPNDEELDAALADGWYMTIRRGGFVRSNTYAPGQLKKRTIYMLAPGSCLRERFSGGMFDLADGGAHPVWRLGKTLFLGVNV